MYENAGALIVAIAFLVALLGSGVGVAFLVGRRSSRRAIDRQAGNEQHLPEHFVKELQRCLELSDYATRDAEILFAIVVNQSPPVARQVAGAVNQLIKTTKSLAA